MTKFDYKTDWQAYTYPETNIISTSSDIKEEFTAVDLTAKKLVSGGIPLRVKNNIAYLNSSDENTIIFGETGSKKTRSAILPLIATTAGAHESAFITDVKGELSANPKVQGYMKAHGINAVYLDFRTFKGDGYNLFERPLNLYRKGLKDKANSVVMKFVNSLSKRYEETTNDLFWPTSAVQLIIPTIMLLLDTCSKKEQWHGMLNMLTLNSYLNVDAGKRTLQAIESGAFGDPDENSILILLRTVLNNPSEKTLPCIYSTAQGMIHDFTIQRDLLNMLSESTFDITEMYDKPTFVFLIIPDETSAYDTISGMLIDTFYCELVDVFSERYQGRKPPKCRINYICDEFCNLHINDMRAKISASRSRFMRWFLVCQSKQQMDAVYADDAGTIIGNCKNVLFLQSSDTEMIEYMSALCGRTRICQSAADEPLVTWEMLKSLKKEDEYKEALFVRDNIKYFAKLMDIDTYEFLKSYESDEVFEFQKKFSDDIKVFSISMLEDVAVDIIRKKRKAEEERLAAESKPKKRTSLGKLSQAEIENLMGVPDSTEEEYDLQKELERKFDELFGTGSDDDNND